MRVAATSERRALARPVARVVTVGAEPHGGRRAGARAPRQLPWPPSLGHAGDRSSSGGAPPPPPPGATPWAHQPAAGCGRGSGSGAGAHLLRPEPGARGRRPSPPQLCCASGLPPAIDCPCMTPFAARTAGHCCASCLPPERLMPPACRRQSLGAARVPSVASHYRITWIMHSCTVGTGEHNINRSQKQYINGICGREEILRSGTHTSIGELGARRGQVGWSRAQIGRTIGEEGKPAGHSGWALRIELGGGAYQHWPRRVQCWTGEKRCRRAGGSTLWRSQPPAGKHEPPGDR